MQRLLAPPPCFTKDEVLWILGRIENCNPGRNPEGQALIEKMRKMLGRTERVTYPETRKVTKRLRRAL